MNETTKPVHGHKLAQLCWVAIMSAEPGADDQLIIDALDYAVSHTGSLPSPESMRKIVEYRTHPTRQRGHTMSLSLILLALFVAFVIWCWKTM